MAAYYNEFDKYAAEWLRNLIKAKLITEGDVDDRSICEVEAKDLKKYTQCHFFAGIGVWSYALKQAGWSEDRPVWTGSCPCQPFSSAGQRKGTADERHLWPEFFRLIKECRPDTIFGEQVASKDGLGWLDIVSSDLEGADYAVGAVSSCAAGFGAPHIRKRLYFLGVGDTGKRRQLEQQIQNSGNGRTHREPSSSVGFSNNTSQRLAWPMGTSIQKDSSRPSDSSNLVQSGTRNDEGFSERALASCDWLPYRDHSWRPSKPGTFPLVNGSPGDVGRLRAYGNALCAPQAQGFIEAYMETL